MMKQMDKSCFGESAGTRKIFQVGFAVENLEDAMQKWTKYYKIGPWRVSVLSAETIPDLMIGKEAVAPNVSYRMATTMVGNIQFELMEANQTTPIYSDFIRERGAGIHHIKERIAEDMMESELGFYKSKGIQTLYGGHYYNASFYYLDTPEQLEGALIELGNCETLIKPGDEN